MSKLRRYRGASAVADPGSEITTAEAARILGITPRSVARAITDGRLNARKIGAGLTSAYLLDLDEVRAYAELTKPAP